MDAGVEIARNLGMAGGFFLLCYVLLKWAVKHWDQLAKEMCEERAKYSVERETLLSQAAVERRAWHDQITVMHGERIRQHEKSQSFHNMVRQAHEFQREEHKEMIKVLQALNGKVVAH